VLRAGASVTGQLEGRVAIVTGASRGIGAGIARAFAAQGAAVAVAARSEEVWNERLPGTIHDSVSTINDAGGRALAVRCDVAQDEDLVRLVETTTAELGTVDILVNNAAVTVPGRPPAGNTPTDAGTAARVASAASGASTVTRRSGMAGVRSFRDFPLKGYRLHFEVNLFAAYRLMQLVLPGMMDLGRGSILNITSDASRRPGEGPYERAGGTTTFAYGGAKMALEHLTRSVAFEVQPHGIGVNALMPSLPVATPGLLYSTGKFAEQVSMEDFCAAALQLVLERRNAPPAKSPTARTCCTLSLVSAAGSGTTPNAARFALPRRALGVVMLAPQPVC
jgi:7-alpha-hydroxysteroid dehydrogenase